MSSPQDPQQQGDQPTPPPGSYGIGYGGTIYPYEGQQGEAAPQGYPYGAGHQPGAAPSTDSAPAYGQTPAYGQPYPYQQQAFPSIGQPPAGLGPEGAVRPPRPRAMLLALILQIVAALPFLFSGVTLLAAPGVVASALPTEVLEPALEGTGLTVDDVTATLPAAIQTLGGIFLVVAALFVLFAVLAFTGRNWARVLVAVMSAGFALLMLINLLGALGSGDVLTLVVVVGLLVVTVVPIVVLFRADANAFFSRVRR